MMKWMILLVLLPFFSYGQTVHVDNKEIKYKGTVLLSKGTAEEWKKRAASSLLQYVGQTADTIVEKKGTVLKTWGSFPLSSTYLLKKVLTYTFTVELSQKGYNYKIGNVVVLEMERGGKVKRLTSEEVFKGMDINGPVAISTEKELNEIDMRLQKVIVQIRNDMQQYM